MVDVQVPLLTTTTTRVTSAEKILVRENSKMIYRRLLIGVSIFGVLAFLVCVYVLKTVPEFNQYSLVQHYRVPNESAAPRTILLWNSFFDSKTWGLPENTLGPDHFRREWKCPIWRCEITNVHAFLPELDMYNAIVFHTAEPFPLLKAVPQRRAERQLYVFALMEPPGETKHILSDEGDFYNLTMTYRLDSDIVWPYMFVEDKMTGVKVAPAQHPNWRQAPAVWNDTEMWQLWEGKTHLVAWFVSHCKTLSKREELASQLGKYVNVDIYGKCGTKSCPYKSDACDQMLDQKYKFYLSFENSLCTDYVTEKFFNALRRQVVPVVFGGANYTQFAPPHSYIDAESFSTVAELANYLKYLDESPVEYLRYFWWRKYYRVVGDQPFCDLCEKLHSPKYRNRQQTYRNIEEWWLGGSCRFESNIKW